MTSSFIAITLDGETLKYPPYENCAGNQQEPKIKTVLTTSRVYLRNSKRISTPASRSAQSRSRLATNLLAQSLKMYSCSNTNFLENGGPISLLILRASRGPGSDTKLSAFKPKRTSSPTIGSLCQGRRLSLWPAQAFSAISWDCTST